MPVTKKIVIERACLPLPKADDVEWLRLRVGLWPEQTRRELDRDRAIFAARSDRNVVFLARRADGRLGGFLEASLREYAEGCATSPVGFIEGWYVDADLRRAGVGRALVRAAEAWAKARGCVEMGSDTEAVNVRSQRAHAALGYGATRMVSFWKRLATGHPRVVARGRVTFVRARASKRA
ncbi:MAG TPA: GNAT family N-acetyltransferase [Polyangia bacterium]|nr:GNAT family N-acetyltransferase [Polyangia bacterium]